MNDTIFSMVKSSFDQYMDKVDKLILSKTQQYDCFFEKYQDNGEKFFRHIFYIIKHFLEDESAKRLFISIPVQELGIISSRYEDTWTCLQGIIADVLSLATSEKQKSIMACPEQDKAQCGTFLYCLNEHSPLFFEIVDSKILECGTRPKLLFKDKKMGSTEASKFIYDLNRDCTYKMKDLPPARTYENCDAHTERHIKYICDRLNLYIKNGLSSQYKSAGIVGFHDKSERYERSYNNIYFDSPLSFSIDASNEILNNEIVCFVGDRKYGNVWDNVNRKIGQGIIKKAIFLGTTFDDFKSDDRSHEYAFSIREMYRYFANNRFPEMELKTLPFPWLSDRIAEFNELIMDMGSLDDNQRKLMVGRVMRNCVGIEYSKPSDQDADRLSDWMNENCRLKPEEKSRILDWYKGLEFQDLTTPKQKYLEDISNGDRTHICNPYSFKNKAKAFIDKKNNEYNTLVFDVIYNAKTPYVQNTKDIFMHMPLGKLIFLSYTPLDKLSDFLYHEPDICNGQYRKSILENIEYKRPEITQNEISKNNLEDYFTEDLLDDMYHEGIERNISHYTLKFSDGSVDVVNGDVIYGNSVVALSDIFEYEEKFTSSEITYYETPSDFPKIFEIVKDFPDGRDVSHFSTLWKKILNNYSEKEYNGDFKKMLKEQFPFLPKSRSKEYINVESEVFPHKFNLLVKRLREMDLVDDLTAKYLIAAHKAKRDSTSIGVALKEALYNYKITGNKNEFLSDFESKSKKRGETINADTLANECLKSKVFVKIDKSK